MFGCTAGLRVYVRVCACMCVYVRVCACMCGHVCTMFACNCLKKPNCLCSHISANHKIRDRYLWSVAEHRHKSYLYMGQRFGILIVNVLPVVYR